MPSRNQAGRETGSVLLGVLFLLMLMGGIAGAMYVRSTSSSKAASRNSTESRLLMTAESGLNVAFGRLQTDALYPVRNVAGFAFAATTAEYKGNVERVGVSGTEMEFTLSFQYSSAGVPVEFANRTNPRQGWDLLQVTSTAAVAGLERRVASWYRAEIRDDYTAAFLSDAKTSGEKVGGGKNQALSGDVVFDDKGRPNQQFVFGGVRANGSVWTEGTGGMQHLTTAAAPAEFAAWKGEVNDMLGGTDGEIPDFTNQTTDQLFDFNRFEAAAAAGAGKVYGNMLLFKNAMNAANTSGKPLEGIIVVKCDPKTDFTLDDKAIPNGVNVRGTLVFRFKPGTDPLYKNILSTPINVNAANLSAWVPANEATYTTAYPPVYALGTKKPYEVDISPTYDNFSQGGDLPALMFENGVIDLHGPVNVSGAVYGPSFIEIENKSATNIQYVNGMVIGGAGILVEGNGNAGNQAFRFSRDCVDRLETSANRLKALVRTRFTILK